MVGWLNYADDELQEICARAVAQGFPAVKIKVGYPTVKQDIVRVECVRKAVGGECGAHVRGDYPRRHLVLHSER